MAHLRFCNFFLRTKETLKRLSIRTSFNLQNTTRKRVREIQMLSKNPFSQLEQIRGGEFAGNALYECAPTNTLPTDRLQI